MLKEAFDSTAKFYYLLRHFLAHFYVLTAALVFGIIPLTVFPPLHVSVEPYNGYTGIFAIFLSLCVSLFGLGYCYIIKFTFHYQTLPVIKEDNSQLCRSLEEEEEDEDGERIQKTLPAPPATTDDSWRNFPIRVTPPPKMPYTSFRTGADAAWEIDLACSLKDILFPICCEKYNTLSSLDTSSDGIIAPDDGLSLFFDKFTLCQLAEAVFPLVPLAVSLATGNTSDPVEALEWLLNVPSIDTNSHRADTALQMHDPDAGDRNRRVVRFPRCVNYVFRRIGNTTLPESAIPPSKKDELYINKQLIFRTTNFPRCDVSFRLFSYCCYAGKIATSGWLIDNYDLFAELEVVCMKSAYEGRLDVFKWVYEQYKKIRKLSGNPKRVSWNNRTEVRILHCAVLGGNYDIIFEAALNNLGIFDSSDVAAILDDCFKVGHVPDMYLLMQYFAKTWNIGNIFNNALAVKACILTGDHKYIKWFYETINPHSDVNLGMPVLRKVVFSYDQFVLETLLKKHPYTFEQVRKESPSIVEEICSLPMSVYRKAWPMLHLLLQYIPGLSEEYIHSFPYKGLTLAIANDNPEMAHFLITAYGFSRMIVKIAMKQVGDKNFGPNITADLLPQYST